MAYTLSAMQIARENGHDMTFQGTVKVRHPNYFVDRYLCRCGGEVQISSSSFIGCWISEYAKENKCPYAA